MPRLLVFLLLLLALLMTLNIVTSSHVISSFLSSTHDEDTSSYSETLLSRHPRYLVYPPRGAFKLVMGMAVPWMTTRGKYLAWTINFQFQYALPINITQLNLPTTFRAGRSLRAIDRNVAYATLEAYMQGRGLHGRACMLRTICEAAEYPLHHNGLLGELIQILLTPTFVSRVAAREGGGGDVKTLDRDYHVAQKLGESGSSCQRAYPQCTTGILDLISVLDT